MAANLTTTYASQILDLLDQNSRGGNAPLPPPPPDKNIPVCGVAKTSVRAMPPGIDSVCGDQHALEGNRRILTSEHVYNVTQQSDR